MVSWSRALQKIGSFIVPVSGGSFLPIPGRSRRQGSRIWVLLFGVLLSRTGGRLFAGSCVYLGEEGQGDRISACSCFINTFGCLRVPGCPGMGWGNGVGMVWSGPPWRFVDATSNFEREAEQWSRRSGGASVMTPDLYLVKPGDPAQPCRDCGCC